MTSLILDPVVTDYLYLGINTGEKYVLGIVQGQDHDSLGVVIGQIKTNSTPCGPSFVDPTLGLIISFLESQASLVLTTPDTCSLNLASSLTLACLFEVGLTA
jgi:hypothetical protein